MSAVRTPHQIIGDDAYLQLVFEGYEVIAADTLAARDAALAEALAEVAEFDETNRQLVKTADGWRDRFRAAEAALAEMRVELERAESTCTAWQEVYEGIEAHLQDRIAMQDQASPETYLSIIRADVARVIESSKRIVAARWADAARNRAATDRAEAELERARKALEPFAKAGFDRLAPIEAIHHARTFFTEDELTACGPFELRP